MKAGDGEVRGSLLELTREAASKVVRQIDANALARLDAVQVVPTKHPEHGDFASNAALVLAKELGRPPREIAEAIERALLDPDGIVAKTEIAGPGFLNFFLARSHWDDLLVRILREGAAFGSSEAGQGRVVKVEFVSANPTGPLTIGHGRNAVLGDAIARLLETTGHQVKREYYFNDGGRQMRVLAQSLRARYEQELGLDAGLPPEGYQGQYLVELAKQLILEHGRDWLEADEARFKERAQAAMFEGIDQALQELGIHFDAYYNEQTLYEEGRVEAALEDLRAAGLVYEHEGAVWLRSTALGLERDRVLVKSTEEATYLLPDIAYHRESLARGYDAIIDVLGPDHIEQFPYVRAAVEALGGDPSLLEAVHYQWVNLRRDGELVKMSTRKASFITVDQLLEDVGPDVFRYFMIERRADTHIDFDVALGRERSERNPVYKIQYAHARLCSVARMAARRGVELPPLDEVAWHRLESPAELELCKILQRFPELVAHAADAREPQEVARYLLDLATAFHSYISDGKRHRVLSDDRELSQARLALVSGIRITLANGLGLLGIAAPERM
ncbi:MAG: arginine--tRNA ligase [Myxococcota bacterium]